MYLIVPMLCNNVVPLLKHPHTSSLDECGVRKKRKEEQRREERERKVANFIAGIQVK